MGGGKNIKVTKAIDMWSLGIIIHELTVAYKPTCYRKFNYGSGPIPFN
jgi:serine/threonine protein kinase